MTELDDIYAQLAKLGVTPEQAAEELRRMIAAKNKSQRRQHIMDAVRDLGGRFLFYDRKESDLLPVFAIEDAIIASEISIDDIVGEFRRQLATSVANRRQEPGRSYP